MRRTSHYSRSPQPRRKPGAGADVGLPPGSVAAAGEGAEAGSGTAVAQPPKGLKAFARRHDRSLLLLGSALLATILAFGAQSYLNRGARHLTQGDIDAAVLHTLKRRPPGPSEASRAYDKIRPSVVLVRRLGKAPKATGAGKTGAAASGGAKGAGAPVDPKKFSLTGVGTGVVFSEDGMIFTNLHVVAGADDVGVVFADGTESEVELLDAQPENDLAVLRAKTLPDDLRPATLRSTRGLNTGDQVLAVGFPFGIGPTATWGVVSGLRREHYSEEGRHNLIDLIQFDAAANPGNSGGPLVTRDGDVVGIVTSILNPTDTAFFVGIAFAVPIENAAKAAGVSPF
jgi:S1-C subfamily serine protease